MAGTPSLRAFALSLLAAWKVLLVGLLAGALLAVLALRAVPPHHTAHMVVGPMGRSGAAGMGARIPAPGSTLRPITELGSGEELLSDFTRYLALLTSVQAARRLADEPEVMQRLFESAWDAERGVWEPPAGPVPMAGRALRRLAGHEAWAPPDPERLARLLQRDLVIESAGAGPMRRIAFRHKDRAFALRLLARVHATADGLLREEAGHRTRAEVDYVRRRLAEGTTAENHRVLGTLLIDQERILMMIDLDLPFAANTVEPPTAPVLSDWPNPTVLVPFGALAGLALALAFASARSAWSAPP